MEKIAESLNTVFHGLYDKFMENPIMFTLFIILCAGIYIIYSQVDSLENYFPSAAHENAQFDASLNRDQLINSALEDSKLFYSADGIVIGQFHNGQYDLTRLPFTKVSITYYNGDLNDEESEDIYEERPISTMNNIMLDMWKNKSKPKCIAREVAQLKDVAYRQRMLRTGLQFISLCPLTNLRDYPIGYISTGYRVIPGLEEQELILDYQATLASRIAGYLQEGTVNEK